MMSPPSRIIACWCCLAGFALVIIGSKLAVIHVGGSDLPVLDQWDGESESALRPYFEGTLSFEKLVAPHNEHRILTTRLYVLGLIRANGQWSVHLETTLNTALHTLSAILLLSLARRWLKGGALVCFGLLLLSLFALPHAWENTLGGFQVQFYFLLLFSLCHLWLVLEAPGLSGRWWLGQICGLLAIASMGSGFLAVVAVLMVSLYRCVRERSVPRHQMITVICGISLSVAGWSLRHHVPGHDVLKASGIGEFAQSFISLLSWPFPSWLPIVMLPPLLFTIKQLRAKQMRPPDRVLLGLIGWSVLQCAAIAYARGGGGSSLSLRYLDLLGINVAVAGLCILQLGTTRLSQGLAFGWSLLVVSMMAIHGRTAWQSWVVPSGIHASQREARLREYVRTGDFALIADRTWPEIPYPDPHALRERLASPAIRDHLSWTSRLPLLLADSAQPPPPSAMPPVLRNAPFVPFLSTFLASDPANFAWRSAPQPSSTLPVLRFRIAGDLGSNPALSLVVKSAAGEVAVIPDTAPQNRWKHVTILRPAGDWWIEARDTDAHAWFAFVAPVEVGRWGWLAEKLIKHHAVVTAIGGALLVLGIAGARPRSTVTAR